MRGDITMSAEEVKRLRLMEQVEVGVITLERVSEALGLSYRHTKRLWRSYRLKGAIGLVHGNRGREPSNKKVNILNDKILKLFQDSYSCCNDTHYTELLSERESINLSRETVRKILRGAGIAPKRSRKCKKHRKRRERMSQRGHMILWDGSPHRWFGKDNPPCCLMSSVDDATGELLAAFFIETEGSVGYLLLLQKILVNHGIPLIAYHDWHTSLIRSDNQWSIEEQLQGRQYPTHIGRILEELGIRSIAANSPQAKGRVERSFGTLQDRLIAELMINNITEIKKANQWINSTFIKRYNQRFAIKPGNEQSSFRPISKDEIYKSVSFAYEATVGNDNCVRLGGLIIDIPPGKQNRGYAKQKVLVRQHIDGAWSVWLKNQLLTKYKSTTLREPIRSWKRRTPDKKIKGAESIIQVYINSKPAPSQRGHFPLAVKGTF